MRWWGEVCVASYIRLWHHIYIRRQPHRYPLDSRLSPECFGRDGRHKNSCRCSYLKADRPVHNAFTMPAKISRHQMKHCFNVGRIKTALLFYLLLMPRGSPFSYLANSCYTGGVFQVINVCSAWKPRDSRRARK
jgi:hypothetical protein